MSLQKKDWTGGPANDEQRESWEKEEKKLSLLYSSSHHPNTHYNNPNTNIASRSKMADTRKIAILSVYDKTGLLDLARGLVQANVR
jgi:hypothetical protein